MTECIVLEVISLFSVQPCPLIPSSLRIKYLQVFGLFVLWNECKSDGWKYFDLKITRAVKLTLSKPFTKVQNAQAVLPMRADWYGWLMSTGFIHIDFLSMQVKLRYISRLVHTVDLYGWLMVSCQLGWNALTDMQYEWTQDIWGVLPIWMTDDVNWAEVQWLPHDKRNTTNVAFGLQKFS